MKAVNPAVKYFILSFPLVGNLSLKHMKKDAGQAGLTRQGITLLSCRVKKLSSMFHPSSSVFQAGFTLVEVLVSTAILSLIVAALYSTFFLSDRAVRGMDDSLLKLHECRMSLDIMGREADSLLAGRGDRNSFFKIEDRDIFGRQTSRFSFTAFSPLRPGLSAIAYYAEEKNGVLSIFKKIQAASGRTAGAKGVEVMEGIDSFVVEARDSTTGKWTKTWEVSEANRLPDELRFTITFFIRDRPIRLSETVRPKIGKTL